jgi:hypothetical protein
MNGLFRMHKLGRSSSRRSGTAWLSRLASRAERVRTVAPTRQAGGHWFEPSTAHSGPPSHAAGNSCLTMSTEISTAGIVPLFSSQWVVFLSSGQPTPGP